MRTIRFMSFILALLMLVSVFALASCGGGAPEETPAESTPAETPKATEPTETEPTETEPTETEPTETEPTETEPEEEKPMSRTEVIKYTKARTVTVVTDTGTGSGFFIDDNGTVVTNYHVIDGASEIEVKTSDRGTYDVDYIVDFNELYDIAVLKVDLKNTPYLDIFEGDLEDGEEVYAVGSPIGVDSISTSGMVSKASQKVGNIDCIVSDATINPGNSGGPLVNAYGEVIGINAFTYTRAEGLSLAVNINNLEKLSMDKEWSISRYRDWYAKEIQRSYKVYSVNDEDYYHSKIYTYQEKTGVECDYSSQEFNTKKSTGYREDYLYYYYDYSSAKFDEYTEYLFDKGFELDDTRNVTDAVLYSYFNEFEVIFVDVYIVGNDYMIISVYGA